MTDTSLERANAIAHQIIICDGHIDFPWRLSGMNFKPEGKFLDIVVHSTHGDFDYVRAKQGGLSAPFMAIYVAATFQKDPGAAKKEADRLIDIVNAIIAAHPEKFARGLSPDMIEENFKRGLISLPLGLENGAPIENLTDIQYYFHKGIRYITLTHAKDNHICDSSYDDSKTWKGLSPFGKEMIGEMNRVGMMVDISHVSDSAFYQVMEISASPVIASHSSCRAFTPGWERNMDDDMIKLLAQKEGIIQINFGSDFLDSEVSKARVASRKELDKRLDKARLKSTDAEAKPIIASMKREFTNLFSDVRRVVDHMDHVRKIAGVDYIGIGSDFDGVGDSLPEGLKDVSMFPNLIQELLTRDFTEEDIEKICYKNIWRVWNKVSASAKV